MFDEKDRIKYVSETFRNLGVTLAAGGVIALVTSNFVAESFLLSLSGFASVLIGYKFITLDLSGNLNCFSGASYVAVGVCAKNFKLLFVT